MSNTIKTSNNYFDEALELSESSDNQQDSELHSKGHYALDPDLDNEEIQVGEYEEDEEEGSSNAALYPNYHPKSSQHLEQRNLNELEETEQVLANRHSLTESPEPPPPSSRPKTGRGPSRVVNVPPSESNLDSEDAEDLPSKYKDSVQSHDISDLSLKNELNELFKYIGRFTPDDIELETELKPFIPDFIPAIGDIDAFIKIPRPDGKQDNLGLSVLDEPAIHQSDPAVLDLHLRAVTKSSSAAPRNIRSLDSLQLKKDPKLLDTWLKNIKDLHSKKPPASVHYSKRMPDIEDLMQVWPEQMEEAFKTIPLPNPNIDLPLADYAQVISLLLDIPVSPPQEKVDASGRKAVTTGLIESLHVLFTLYSEFKNSAHFKAMDRTDQTNLNVGIEMQK